MKELTTRGLPAVLAALALTATGLGDTGEDLRARIAELETKSSRDDHRIAELESRLSSLETTGSDGWLTRQRAEEIRGLVGDVLVDADARSSLRGGMEAGYDNGAVLASSDGNWLMRTNFQMQQRLVFNRQSNSPSGDNTRWGFEVARAKFIMSGHVVSPEWFYTVEVELSGVNTGLPNGQTRTGLGDAYAGYDFGNGWRIGAGIFKTPLLREDLVDSRYQLAVERSVVNYMYTGARTTGFAAHYEGQKFHFTGSVNNGISDGVYGGSILTGPVPVVTTPSADFAISARGEWLIKGTWDPF
ncbi:MAG: porin, partial [Planctomycetota bacterium]